MRLSLIRKLAAATLAPRQFAANLPGMPRGSSARPFQFMRNGCAWIGFATALAVSAPAGAAFQPYVIRNASAPPNNSPIIQPNNSYPPAIATEFIISAGGQKAALGSSDVDGSRLGSLASLAIERLDDRTRFTAGTGPYVAPYLNFWITDGRGHYAVVANEPSDGNFQPLYNNGYNLSWADLADKVAKVYENSDLSWLPTTGSSGLPAQAGRQNPLSANMYTFADLAAFVIRAPSVAELTAGWPGLGTGAPRELGTNNARGVNWVFGDTLSSYVSGDEGYVVANAEVSTDSVCTDFESFDLQNDPNPTLPSGGATKPPALPIGTVHGQDGWTPANLNGGWTVSDRWGYTVSSSGRGDGLAVDEEVVALSGGGQAWRMSNAKYFGLAFSAYPFSSVLPDALVAGETGAYLYNDYGPDHTAPLGEPANRGRAAQTHSYCASFDFTSASGVYQSGLRLDVNAASKQSATRYTLTKLEDLADGLSVSYYDYNTGGGHVPSCCHRIDPRSVAQREDGHPIRGWEHSSGGWHLPRQRHRNDLR